MRKVVFVVLMVLGMLAQAFGQGADDNTIIRQGPSRSWPAGPYSDVSTNFGVMTTSIPLINVKGKGLTSLSLAAVHRSFSSGNDTQLLPLGKGWSHTGVNYLFQNNGMTRMIANRASDMWKTNVGTGLWDRRPGTRDTLTQISSGFLVTDYSSKVQYYYEYFFGSYINLTRVVDPFGNTVTYTYLPNSMNVDRITDASGRFIRFTYGKPYANGGLVVTNIHLEANGHPRDWDMSYGYWDFGNGIVTYDYLNQILFPNPDVNLDRPAIQFNNDSSGRIVDLLTFYSSRSAGNHWSYKYAPIYTRTLGNLSLSGVVEVDQPSQGNPSVPDTTHVTKFSYDTNFNIGGGGGANDEIYCRVTDPLGYAHTHEYWDYVGPSGQNTTDFPFPIKYVDDPLVTLYTDPRHNQTPTTWQFYEYYHWNTADATLDTFMNKEGHTTSFTYYTAGDYLNRGLVYTKSITNDDGTIFTDTYGYAADGKLTSHSDPYGTVTAYTYDPNTRALTQEALDPSGQNVTKNYAYGSVR